MTSERVIVGLLGIAIGMLVASWYLVATGAVN